MTTEEFSEEVGKIFQEEWQRARRKTLALAFTAGMIVGTLFGALYAENVTKMMGGGGKGIVTDQQISR